MNITNSNLNQFRVEFEEAMKSLEKKYQIQIQLGGISFNEAEFKASMVAKNLSKDGTPVSNPATEAKAALALTISGFKTLKGAVIGSTVTLSNFKAGVIVDYSSKNFKYPFIVKIGSSNYKVAVSQISAINGIERASK